MRVRFYIVAISIILLIVGCDGSSKSKTTKKSDTQEQTPTTGTASSLDVKIAKWRGNKKAALLMYFDDSTPGQAQLAIPFLNKLGFVGTFFVNPGGSSYKKHKKIWEHDSQKVGGGCQELANHSMNHHGAKDYDEADYEIGEPSKIIWKARKDAVNGSLIAFNRGGGTGWNISDEELATILKKYKNVNRLKNYIGEPMVGTQILPGSKIDKILRNKDEALSEGKILMLSFHGIAAVDGNPPKDWGNGAVYVEEFKKAINELKNEDKFWSGGYIQIYKYIQERKTASKKLLKLSDIKYELHLDTTKDKKYFNEPLTILIDLPYFWSKCSVVQGGKKLDYRIKNKQLQFDALPDKNKPITIERKGDFYVSLSGNDSNNGSQAKPFKTISKAISSLSGGGLIVVANGDYKEYINIKKSGTTQKPIEIVAQTKQKAKVLGFRILNAHKYIRINGFEVESNMNYPNDKKGFMSYGGEYVQISDCYIHDCPAGGIAIINNSSNTLIKDNIIEHNGCYGVYMDGDKSIIENNIISKTVQNHPKFNASQIPEGADADGIVIFGKEHTIRYNKIIDLAQPQNQNTDPHSDAIQSSSSPKSTVLQNSQIYGNYIRIAYKSGKGVILESKGSDECKDIVIANNIIEFTDIGIDASYGGKYQNIKIYNNIFKSNLKQKSWGVGVYLKNIVDYEFINNITIDCHNEHRKITGGSGVVDFNLAYNSDANTDFTKRMTPKKQANELITDPKFIKYTGKHGENDYRLQSNSPAINKGKELAKTDATSKDFNKTARPKNKWDIGAFEQ